MKILKILWILCILPFGMSAQMNLKATGKGDTYKILTDALAPGGNAVEVPDCAHPEFGPHITQVFDEDLGKYAFAFHIHVTPDDDRCKKSDRQRNEIKAYGSSPDYLKGFEGETVYYEWSFKIPEGFQSTSKFTHLHQIKAVGGDDAMPLFTLTAREGKGQRPDYLELIHFDQRAIETLELNKIEGQWIRIFETIKVDRDHGSFEIEIRNLKTNELLLKSKIEGIQTILPSNNFIRPKWGIYRSLLEPKKLRDEILYFDDFVIFKETETTKIEDRGKSNLSLFNFKKSSNGELTIDYVLQTDTDLRLDVLNENGEIVKTILRKKKEKQGSYQEVADLSDMESGNYVLRFMSDTYTEGRAFSL